MEVLHISGAKSWGGNEQQLLYLVEELNKLDVSQMIICPDGSPLHEEIKNFQVDIRTLKGVKAHSPRFFNFLKEIIKNNSVDLIHLHTSDAVTGYVLTDILYSLRTPTILSRKGVRSKNGILSSFKYNYKNIVKILCVSDYVKKHFGDQLLSRNGYKLVTVHDGIRTDEVKEAPFQLREKLQLAEDTYLIGNIANHTNAKDLPTLIRSMDFLVNKLQDKNVHLVQIGNNSKKTAELKTLVKACNLEANVTFTGFVKDASTFLSQFDVFVMSSSREGGPSSVLEAMYHKTAVISTRVGVVEEAIKDGENGFVVEVGDDERMARKILELKDRPELRKMFADKSYSIFLANFTAERLGMNTFEIYKKLVAEQP